MEVFLKKYDRMLVGLAFLLAVYTVLCIALGKSPIAHSAYDSYSLQAARWIEGHIALPYDYPWLELAIYDGIYYVSFPPAPALVMLPFVLLFGDASPSNLVPLIALVLSYIVGYLIAQKFTKNKNASALFALLLIMGCCLFPLAFEGGVWFMAQWLSFLFTLLCIFCLLSDRKWMWGLALVFLAAAAGCRPFQALYTPAALILLYSRLKKGDGALRTLLRMIPYGIAPLIIAGLYMWYNWYRFGSVFEFGHNYLPEFTRSEYGQLSVHYMKENFLNILRLPYFEDGKLTFPMFSGFLFFLASPMFVPFFVYAVRSAIKRRLSPPEIAAAVGIMLHFTLFLMHKSLGGWQFGARYFCDLLPVAYVLILSARSSLSGKDGARLGIPMLMLIIFAIAFNIFGTIWFWSSA